MELRQTIRKLARKGWNYWLVSLIAGAGGLWLSHKLSEYPFPALQYLRLKAYEVLSRSSPKPPQIGNVVVVGVTDDEYWKGYLAGRRPTKRDYLGQLITAVCRADPAVVGLDFDLASPFPGGQPLTHPDYLRETSALAEQIRSVPNCRIVLPASLSCPHPPSGVCSRQPAALDDYQFDPTSVSSGYINLPADPRQLPMRRANVEDGTLDSFAQALAAVARKHTTTPLHEGNQFPYGTFLPPSSFEHAGAVISAGSVRDGVDSHARDLIRHSVVLIGATWHAAGYATGPLVDSHISPVGLIPGVYLHANYVAAMLEGNLINAVPEWVVLVIEALVVTTMAVLLALSSSWLQRWTYLVGAVCLLALLSYVFWQNLGIFLEVTIPMVLLVCHSVVDEYRKLREEVSNYRDKVDQLTNELANARSRVPIADSSEGG